jgi:hypothetical protein
LTRDYEEKARFASQSKQSQTKPIFKSEFRRQKSEDRVLSSGLGLLYVTAGERTVRRARMNNRAYFYSG